MICDISMCFYRRFDKLIYKKPLNILIFFETNLYHTAILPNLKGNSKFAIIRQPNSILNLSILPNSYRNLIPLKGFFVKSSAILINLASYSAFGLLPILSFSLNSEELLIRKINFIYFFIIAFHSPI
jgi:hypothetical protein